MITHCPICGKALTELEIVVSEHDMSYQCHNCWNRIRIAENRPSRGELVETTSGGSSAGHLDRRRSARDHGRKS